MTICKTKAKLLKSNITGNKNQLKTENTRTYGRDMFYYKNCFQFFGGCGKQLDGKQGYRYV